MVFLDDDLNHCKQAVSDQKIFVKFSNLNQLHDALSRKTKEETDCSYNTTENSGILDKSSIISSGKLDLKHVGDLNDLQVASASNQEDFGSVTNIRSKSTTVNDGKTKKNLKGETSCCISDRSIACKQQVRESIEIIETKPTESQCMSFASSQDSHCLNAAKVHCLTMNQSDSSKGNLPENASLRSEIFSEHLAKNTSKIFQASSKDQKSFRIYEKSYLNPTRSSFNKSVVREQARLLYTSSGGFHQNESGTSFKSDLTNERSYESGNNSRQNMLCLTDKKINRGSRQTNIKQYNMTSKSNDNETNQSTSSCNKRCPNTSLTNISVALPIGDYHGRATTDLEENSFNSKSKLSNKHFSLIEIEKLNVGNHSKFKTSSQKTNSINSDSADYIHKTSAPMGIEDTCEFLANMKESTGLRQSAAIHGETIMKPASISSHTNMVTVESIETDVKPVNMIDKCVNIDEVGDVVTAEMVSKSIEIVDQFEALCPLTCENPIEIPHTNMNIVKHEVYNVNSSDESVYEMSQDHSVLSVHDHTNEINIGDTAQMISITGSFT